MWKRNLFFIGVCLLGLAALGANLAPLPRPAAHRELPTVDIPPDLAELIARLDATFEQQWSAAGITPTGRADDLTLARRMSLALAGTIPSLEEIRLLEAQSPDHRAAWYLEGLLADRRTHDYLAERLARMLVGVEDGPFIIYRRRRFVSWLSDELRANRPYDQIIRQVLSDTGLWTDHPATNFITVTIKADQEKDPDAKQLAGRTARALLGIRMDCAECHDHPFDRWKQSDFEHLAAFFGQAKQSFAGIQDDASRSFELEGRKTGKMEPVPAAVPFQSELLPDDGTLRERLAVWVTHPANRAFARATVNRLWAVMFGRPLVEPIDGLNSSWGVPAAIDLLAADFAEHGYDLRRLIRAIALSAAFSRASAAVDDATADADPAAAAAWAAFPLVRLRPEQVVGSLLQASSLKTLDYQSHILVRVAKAGAQNDFIRSYGDAGSDEFALASGTIPQRLLMLNGQQVQERTKENFLFNASTQIAALAPDDARAVEAAYLAVLSRRPTAEESAHFEAELASQTRPAAEGAEPDRRSRNERLEDLCWTLLNSTEFSWNH